MKMGKYERKAMPVTTNEATYILVHTITQMVKETVYTYPTLSRNQKAQMLNTAMRRNRIPFQDKNVIKELIPVAEAGVEFALNDSFKSDGDYLTARSGELYFIAADVLRASL